MDRRQLIKSVLMGMAVSPALSFSSFAHQDGAKSQTHHHDMSGMDIFPNNGMGNEQIIMMLYPGFTALDLVGPQYMFGSLMGAKVHLVSNTLEPVACDTGFSIVPTTTFENAPKKTTVLMVPGSAGGMLKSIQNSKFMDFIFKTGNNADYVTSVCTGSIILGAAGLLEGYKATSHWATHDLLAEFGAIPTDERVVTDRNRITAAGVSAGIDFGLLMAEKFRGKLYAEGLQLLSEYNPKPHLNAGSVETAPKEVHDLYKNMFKNLVQKTGEAGAKSFNQYKKLS